MDGSYMSGGCVGVLWVEVIWVEVVLVFCGWMLCGWKLYEWRLGGCFVGGCCVSGSFMSVSCVGVLWVEEKIFLSVTLLQTFSASLYRHCCPTDGIDGETLSRQIEVGKAASSSLHAIKRVFEGWCGHDGLRLLQAILATIRWLQDRHWRSVDPTPPLPLMMLLLPPPAQLCLSLQVLLPSRNSPKYNLSFHAPLLLFKPLYLITPCNCASVWTSCTLYLNAPLTLFEQVCASMYLCICLN